MAPTYKGAPISNWAIEFMQPVVYNVLCWVPFVQFMLLHTK